MDPFEFNKVAMALLATIFVIFGVNIVSEAIFHAEAPEEPAYILAEVGDPAGGAVEETGPAYEPVEPLLASADIEAGEDEFKKCAACHTTEQGGPNKVGPNLWDIVNRDIAANEEFSYSSGMEAFGEGKQWTYEELNAFLYKPKSYVKGTAMGFVGLKDVEDRANVIAYLRTLSGDPQPLPDPAAAEIAGDGAGSAGGEDPQADDGDGAAESTPGGTTGDGGASN